MSVIAPVKPYFKYAMDLKGSVPAMAYYCKLYGVQKGFELMKKAPGDTSQVKTFLMGEMADLENMFNLHPRLACFRLLIGH